VESRISGGRGRLGNRQRLRWGTEKKKKVSMVLFWMDTSRSVQSRVRTIVFKKENSKKENGNSEDRGFERRDREIREGHENSARSSTLWVLQEKKKPWWGRRGSNIPVEKKGKKAAEKMFSLSRKKLEKGEGVAKFQRGGGKLPRSLEKKKTRSFISEKKEVKNGGQVKTRSAKKKSVKKWEEKEKKKKKTLFCQKRTEKRLHERGMQPEGGNEAMLKEEVRTIPKGENRATCAKILKEKERICQCSIPGGIEKKARGAQPFTLFGEEESPEKRENIEGKVLLGLMY